MSWLALGWLGQALFTLRFAVQWWASERAGQSVAPPLFWWLSLGGALAVGSYAWASGERVLAAGHMAGVGLYARSAWLHARPGGRRPGAPALAVVAGCLAALLAAATWAAAVWHGQTRPGVWLAVATAGQLLWQTRFVAQWWASERAGFPHFPRAFWWLSLAGNLLLLAYALQLGDPLFVYAYLLGPVAQLRNLVLAGRTGAVASAPVLAQ